ncbi:hypothetical protein [Georgenia sp. AZ-5]|uniref:hypothetical protein n=1 Tax=Georgenia sp. AZ-5 TaxID=3367526 RepID=UPI003754505E
MPAPLVVPARYCGPPHSANGGWVSGHAARLVRTTAGLPAVSVRLVSPPPLDRPMRVRPADGAVEVLDDEHLVLRAGPAAAPAGDVPDPVRYDEAVAAGASFPGLRDHPFPTCFVCGTARDPADALALRPGPVAGGRRFAAAWVPEEPAAELVWAALDCPGAWALGVGGRPMVLGTMTARVHALPDAGAEHVVMAWARGVQGRKHLSGTALHAADGRLLARAEATWIAVDPAQVRPASAAP